MHSATAHCHLHKTIPTLRYSIHLLWRRDLKSIEQCMSVSHSSKTKIKLMRSYWNGSAGSIESSLKYIQMALMCSTCIVIRTIKWLKRVSLMTCKCKPFSLNYTITEVSHGQGFTYTSCWWWDVSSVIKDIRYVSLLHMKLPKNNALTTGKLEQRGGWATLHSESHCCYSVLCPVGSEQDRILTAWEMR